MLLYIDAYINFKKLHKFFNIDRYSNIHIFWVLLIHKIGQNIAKISNDLQIIKKINLQLTHLNKIGIIRKNLSTNFSESQSYLNKKYEGKVIRFLEK